MLAGEHIDGCVKCYRDEEFKGESMRIMPDGKESILLQNLK